MNYIEFRSVWYNKFKHIQYDDDKHQYWNKNTNQPMISVTQLINKFKPKFDTEYWSNVKAKENNITQEEMLKKWEDTKNEGLDIGNRIHDYIEKRMNGEVFSHKIQSVEEYLEYCKDDIPFMQEVIVGNDKIAGRFDHLCIRDNKLVIKDWKTNKKFNVDSKYMLCNGLEHISNCEYNIYALQTSLYQYLMDLDVSDREVVWFDRDGNYHIYKVPYLEHDVITMLNYGYS